MIVDPAASIRQVLRMIKEGKVGTVQGEDLAVSADTLCIHGDQAGAVVFAQAIRQALKDENISVRKIGS